MKKIIVFAFALIAIIFLYNKFRVAPSLPGDSVVLLDSSGVATRFTQLPPGEKIITFYASWCGDCLSEMKTLNEVYAQLNGLPIYVITDEGLEKMNDFADRKKYPFQFYTLKVPFSEINIHSIPVTYILNAKGEIVYEKVGAINWKDKSFRAHVESLIVR